MSEPDDIDLVAAEYVLGTLPPEERIAIAARRQREPELDAAITSWEKRLAPLAEFIPEVASPETVLSDLERRLEAIAEGNGAGEGVLVLKRRLVLWRRIAAGAAGLAAAALLVLILRETLPPGRWFSPKPTNFVALLQKDAASPAFVVSVDIATRVMTVRSVAAEKLAGKSYELWLVNASFANPRSLGVVREDKKAAAASLATYSFDVVTGSTYAVTLEPEGGSPSGLPTGEVVFSGKLVQVD